MEISKHVPFDRHGFIPEANASAFPNLNRLKSRAYSMAPPRLPRTRPNGVALGVLGMMFLVFFSMVFMLGRHHYSISETYEAVVHDPRYQHIIESIEGRPTGSDGPLNDLR